MRALSVFQLAQLFLQTSYVSSKALVSDLLLTLMVTIREVAAAAGVSASTVSYVVTGNKRLPAETVAKVRASIRDLGYRPNAAGRALSLGRTNIIGVVTAVRPGLPDAEADIFMRFVLAAMFSAKRYGYNILMMDGGIDDLQATQLVDGLLVMDIRYREERIEAIRSRGIPIVLVGMPLDTGGLSAVDLDFAEAGRLAVNHLADLGHRHIAVLGSLTPGTSELSWSVRFGLGAESVAAEREVRLSPWAGGSTVAELDRWLDDVADDSPGATAIVMLNVALIEPLLRRVAERGVVIPEDLSLVVLASGEQMDRVYPAVTLLDVPGAEMLETATQMLIALMAREEPGSTVLLPARLETRGSTAPPKPGALRRLASEV